MADCPNCGEPLAVCAHGAYSECANNHLYLNTNTCDLCDRPAERFGKGADGERVALCHEHGEKRWPIAA